MLRHIALASLVLCFIYAPARAEDIPAESALKSATVYADRAALTRRAKVEVPAGKHVIVLEGLSTGLYADSLRVEGEGSAPVTLGALSHKVVYNQDLINEKEKALNDALEVLGQKRQGLMAEKAILDKKKAFFDALQAQAVSSLKEEISVYQFNTDKWLEASKTLETGLSEEATARLALDEKLKALQKEEQKLRNELAQIRTGRKSSLEVRIPVEAARAGSLTLDLSYQIPGARWSPVYDARLDTKTGRLDLAEYGSVSQNTGEDWRNIALTLSTAQPQRGADMPTLGPMWVNLMQNIARLKKATFAPGTAPMSAAYTDAIQEQAIGAGASAVPVPIEPMIGMISVSEEEPMQRWRKLQQERINAAPVAAQLNTGGFTAEYAIPGPSSVPADGTQNKVYIGTFENKSEMRVHIKPQTAPQAFLVAHLTLGGDNMVLPGPVNLFRDNAFIGRTMAGYLRPGEEIDVSFGIDDLIQVERKTLKDEKSASGMFVGKSDVLERNYVTQITNLRPKPVDIVVDETVPTPQDEQIQAEILPAATTQGYETDADKIKGLLRWSFSLDPKKQKDVELGWRVSWPQGQSVTGLP